MPGRRREPDTPAEPEAAEPDELELRLAELEGRIAEVSAIGFNLITGAVRERDEAHIRLMEATRDRTLDDRMTAVQAELEDVPRRGHAEVTTQSGGTYSYDYITEADLMTGVRPLLAKHGIAVYYSDRIVELRDGLAIVEVELRLRANGEELRLTGQGIGTDRGDKHANKAKTSAVRYLLWKTFLQPSDEDPELENVDAASARAAAEGRITSSRRQPSRQPARTTTRPKLLETLNRRALELDEGIGELPGTTLSRLPELVASEWHVDDYPNGLSENQIVAIGKRLSELVAAAGAGEEITLELPTNPDVPFE